MLAYWSMAVDTSSTPIGGRDCLAQRVMTRVSSATPTRKWRKWFLHNTLIEKVLSLSRQHGEASCRTRWGCANVPHHYLPVLRCVPCSGDKENDAEEVSTLRSDAGAGAPSHITEENVRMMDLSDGEDVLP